MKQKMSISIEEGKVKILKEYVKKGIFRNKSHAIEKGLDILLKNLEETNNV